MAARIAAWTRVQACGRPARACTSLGIGRGSMWDIASGAHRPVRAHAGFGVDSQLLQAQWVESFSINRACRHVRTRVVCGLDEASRFRSLYGEYQPDVLAYFMRRLSRNDAVDATADVFLTAWRRIDDVPLGSGARLWLFGVARNVLRNQQRGLRRRGRLWAKLAITRADPDPLPETVVLQREEDREMIAALDRLRPQDREVLTMRLWEETSFDDIAAVMRCSRHAAEQRYGRALRRLQSITRRPGHGDVSEATPDLPKKEPMQ